MGEKKKKQTKWDSFQTESICASKDTVRKVKGQLTEWEKILERHISERDLYPQYIKNSDNSTMKKQTTQFKNGQKGFPSWLRGKESACQCRRHGFDPWSGKIPCAMGQLSLCATTKLVHHNYWACSLEPRSRNYWAHMLQLSKPACRRACALQQEKSLQWDACSLQLEKAYSQQWRPSTVNKFKKFEKYIKR